MNDKVLIPYNDVFFYGLALRDRENADIKQDVFANILMRYLRTLEPVSSKLYRRAGNNKFEYSYSFVPTKPLYWRVIKNRHITEEIEQLSDGKYCLNYYDDQGNDVKRVIFNSQHKWVKTNYYNSVYGNDIICSIVPKELNGQTVILKYPTGATYPVPLHCCPVASCEEVKRRVFLRVPEPDLMALTNYGILYYANEETLNIYNQVLAEEELKYSEETKPPVYTTEEDIAGGFCFSTDSFDSTKNTGSVFDLSEASELTEDGFSDSYVNNVVIDEVEIAIDAVSVIDQLEDNSPYSVDADIQAAIKAITDATDIHINEDIVFPAAEQQESLGIDSVEVPKVEAIDGVSAKFVDVIEETTEDNISEDLEAEASDKAEVPVESSETVVEEVESTPKETASDAEPAEVSETLVESNAQNVEFLTMADEDIDDYVKTLIDSMLLNAKEAAAEYTVYSEEGFTAGAQEAVVESESDSVDMSKAADYINDYSPDTVIESNGAKYFYYGETDENGKRSGRGRTLMEDGKTAYDGEYNADMRHGVGSFYYKDGSLCYWGNWQENLRNGFGVGISSETGLIHMGSWHNNKPTGVGVRFDSEGKFLYLDSGCQRTNGGIRITGFTENSFTVEFWDEKTLKVIKKEISLDDLLK